MTCLSITKKATKSAEAGLHPFYLDLTFTHADTLHLHLNAVPPNVMQLAYCGRALRNCDIQATRKTNIIMQSALSARTREVTSPSLDENVMKIYYFIVPLLKQQQHLQRKTAYLCDTTRNMQHGLHDPIAHNRRRNGTEIFSF